MKLRQDDKVDDDNVEEMEYEDNCHDNEAEKH